MSARRYWRKPRFCDAELVELDEIAWISAASAMRLVDAHRHVADAELERVEERVRADVPPDLLGVVDAVGLDEQVDEVLELGERARSVRGCRCAGSGRRLAAEALQARVAAEPEGGVRRQREDVRQEVAGLVHDLDRQLAVLDADVDVQAEDEVRAREQLQVLDDLVVALVGIDLLVGQSENGCVPAGDDAQAVLLGEPDDLAAQSR